MFPTAKKTFNLCSPGLPNLILFLSSSSSLRLRLKIVYQLLLTITVTEYFNDIMKKQNRHSPRFGFMSEGARRFTFQWDSVEGFSFLIFCLFPFLSVRLMNAKGRNVPPRSFGGVSGQGDQAQSCYRKPEE